MGWPFRSGVAGAIPRLLIALATIGILWGPVPCRSDEASSGPRGPDEAGLSDLELLGKRLFEDTSLSVPAGQACASCHDPRQAFQGNDGSPVAAVASGARPGILGVRNTPTLLYAAFAPPFSFVAETGEDGKVEYTPTGGQFWDGRADTLAEQVTGPLLNPLEMNNPTPASVVAKVAAGPEAALARKVFGPDWADDPGSAIASIAGAIAAFESTPRFMPFSSKFDDVLRGKAAFSPEEAEGFALFKDPQRGNCLACHIGKPDSHEPSDWLFTDFTYDNLGAPRNPEIPANAAAGHYDLGLCNQPGIEKKAPPGFEVRSLCGAFKVPTLRDIALTGPYLHNGRFRELRDVVAFYATRDTDAGRWFPRAADGSVARYDDLPAEDRGNVNTDEAPYDRKPGETPRLDDRQIDAIVAFLQTLTDRPR